MSDELPKGWKSIRLEDIVTARKGKKPNSTKAAPSNGFVPYLDIQAIEKGTISSYAEAASSRLGTTEDILVVWDGARSGWAGLGRIGAIGSTIMALQPKSTNRIYIYRWLQSNFHYINTNTRGTGIPHVDPEIFWNLEIPIPPLAEQKRIVAKLEKLLGKVDACQKRLAKIPVLLKRFRQSVLAAACSGRLTEDWRKENPLANEKATINHSADLPDIPESWRWVKLSETGEMNRGRSRHRPRDEASLYGGPYPFVQTGDIARSGGRITSHKQTYSKAGLAQSRLWDAGTICITIAANIAESAILTYPACFPDSIVGIISDSKIVKAEYVEFFIRVAKADLAAFAPATAQKNINVAILNEVQVPLPPLPEQQEIVRRVEALFALADKIETRFQKAQAHVDKLTQSLLAKAFRGELVPQDPNDEPAEKLLERIRTNNQDS